MGEKPAFFVAEHVMTTSIQDTVEDRLRATDPAVEVLLAEVVGGGTLRVVIDHPDGVSLELCAQVTHHLGDLRETYGIEVSSPGSERPLVTSEHFRRFLGRRARVRTRQPIAGGGDAEEPRRSFTGELVGADDRAVTLAADSGIVTIPYAEIHRSNLVEE
ncbi:ribosome maturation factor RimP [Patulibacter medicamentivorans]|uniref:ribosome maturation factor RimP n=1 Tax=Patulibacter medicamentivorans TaxID=1097667 RepID=UPI001FCB8F3C|nr:ribosome maturation factor RimP [Patulibacter medicamentivorans]